MPKFLKTRGGDTFTFMSDRTYQRLLEDYYPTALQDIPREEVQKAISESAMDITQAAFDELERLFPHARTYYSERNNAVRVRDFSHPTHVPAVTDSILFYIVDEAPYNLNTEED